jgi:hypothetical protein
MQIYCPEALALVPRLGWESYETIKQSHLWPCLPSVIHATPTENSHIEMSLLEQTDTVA